MRRFTISVTAVLVAWVGAVAVAQQVTAPADLDATMKRVGPAAGATGKSVNSMAFADARMQIPVIRTGIMEAEAFFASKKKEDGVNFARDVLAKVDALDKALAAVASTAPAAGVPQVSPLDAPMKRVGPAAGGAGKAIASMAYADARTQLGVVRTGVMEAEAFFAGRKVEDATNFAKDVLAKVDALDKILAAPTVDQTAAQATLKEMQGACGACHTVYRVRDDAMNFVLRPGAAPTDEQRAAQGALREVQGACNACHTAYRSNMRGEWILKPGSV